MTRIIQWLAPDNPLPSLEKKWTSGGDLDPNEIELLETNQAENPDIRVREHCRTLLNALRSDATGEDLTEADPHGQRLRRLRNQSNFLARTVRA